MKYCPNCLSECSVSHYGGYACNPCGILQYCTAILLDSPDTEKQRDYKLRELLKKVVNYNVDEEGLNNLIIDLKEILTTSH